MRLKRPKWLTIYNIVMVAFCLSVIMGFILICLNREWGRWCFDFAYGQFAVLAYLEVTKLKEWGSGNLSALIKAGEVSARAAYKLKQRGGIISINSQKIE